MPRCRVARSLAACVAALAVLSGCAGEPAAAGTTVTIRSGVIHGRMDGGLRIFEGIRYAQPPVGALRWAPPKPVAYRSGTTETTRPGSPCPQRGTAPGMRPSENEDCLFLNVSTPAEAQPGPLPVIVWWHGGGLVSGSGADYVPRALAERGKAMVVTVNYRLGNLGYLALGAPPAPGSATGDYGLQDQIASLRWVRDNAAAFGGDPGNVTVAGESAGGFGVCAALTSPLTKGLIDRAIMASGSCLVNWPRGGLYPGSPAQGPYVAQQEQAQRFGTAFAGDFNCSTVDCLRRVPVAELLRSKVLSARLSYGSPVLPRDPAAALRQGETLAVPVLAGSNAAEMRPFVAAFSRRDPITADDYATLVRDSFGPKASRVLAEYPPSTFDSPATAWAAVATDSMWACPTLAGNSFQAEHAPLYAYEFADPRAPDVNGLGRVPGLELGAAHGADLPYVFDTRSLPGTLTPAQRGLADQMVDYWAHFARTGDPNDPAAEDAPRWPDFARGGETLNLAPGAVRVGNFPVEHRCDFWNGLDD